MKRLVVIPARYGSTRLPGKPLVLLKGKPLIQYAYEIAKRSLADKVIIATDDRRVLEVAQGFGAEVVLTSKEHPSGTDRVAEVVREMEVQYVVNLQCDEPLLPSHYIDLLFSALEEKGVDMATLVSPLEPDELTDPNVVKVVMDREGFALYFSRAPIPFSRDKKGVRRGLYWRHIGIYGYRKEALLWFTALPPSPLEEEEKLEQLRALENGMRILLIPCEYRSPSVDTEEDLKRLEPLLS